MKMVVGPLWPPYWWGKVHHLEVMHWAHLPVQIPLDLKFDLVQISASKYCTSRPPLCLEFSENWKWNLFLLFFLFSHGFLHQLMTEPPAGLLVMLSSIHISLDDFKTWIKKSILLHLLNHLVIALYTSDMMWVPSFPFYQSREIESNLPLADIGVGPKQ